MCKPTVRYGVQCLRFVQVTHNKIHKHNLNIMLNYSNVTSSKVINVYLSPLQLVSYAVQYLCRCYSDFHHHSHIDIQVKYS
jgi:hypothetical protein